MPQIHLNLEQYCIRKICINIDSVAAGKIRCATQREHFCLHFSNYRNTLIFFANQWSALTYMSTQIANCHPVSIAQSSLSLIFEKYVEML